MTTIRRWQSRSGAGQSTSGDPPRPLARSGLLGFVLAAFMAGAFACGDRDHPDLGVDVGADVEPAEVAAEPARIDPSPLAAADPRSPGPDSEDAPPPLDEDAYGRWAVLLATNLIAEARSLCTGWLEDPSPSRRIEANKCLANVEIAEGRLPPVPELAPGASQLQPRHEQAAIERALAHYDAALEINPLEQASHMGRIDILILSGRYRDANTRLEESLVVFDSRDMLASWLKLLGRFHALGKYDEALVYLKVIEKHHPLDDRVIANLGAHYAIRGQYDEALDYAKQSVALDPDDPINRWNLARLYDHNGELKLANDTYLEALALFQDEDPRALCDYAEFLATRIGEPDDACEFARTRCNEYHEQHCSEPG